MTSSRYDDPMAGDPAWEAADIRSDVWVDDARARLQAEAEERSAEAERHAAKPGYTGMTCERMQLDEDGYGDTCGRAVSDAIHGVDDEAEMEA